MSSFNCDDLNAAISKVEPKEVAKAIKEFYYNKKIRNIEKSMKAEESKAKPKEKKLGKKSKEIRKQSEGKQEKAKGKKGGKCK